MTGLGAEKKGFLEGEREEEVLGSRARRIDGGEDVDICLDLFYVFLEGRRGGGQER